MDAAYLEAAIPEPFTVLGKRLKPFCLGHEILFQRFKNRFSVESEEPPQIEDLLTGVFICSQRYSKDVSLDYFSVPLRVKLYARLFGPSYLGRAFALFSNYIASHTALPHFDSVEDDGKREPMGAPTVQVVKVSLMGNLGLSEDEALNTPFGLAFWNHLSWAEMQGHIKIIDEEEMAKIEAAKAFESQVEEMREKLQARMKSEEVSLGA